MPEAIASEGTITSRPSVGTGETGRHVTETTALQYIVTVLLHFEHFSGAFQRFTDATTHSTARRSNLCKKLRATWRPRFVAATPRHTRRSTVARDGGLCFREMMRRVVFFDTYENVQKIPRSDRTGAGRAFPL